MKIDLMNLKPEFIITDQGTNDWQNLKLAVISASNISRAIAKKGTETRNSYMNELIGQVFTREFDELNAKALDWGKANEVAARAAYEFETGESVEQIGFVYNLDKRIGCSPDGIIKGKTKGLEIKCPMTAKVHVDFLSNEKIKPEYLYQVQFSMFVTGFESWDFCSYHPKFTKNMLKIKTFERDPKLMERFSEEVGEFIYDMDMVLKELGVSFGDQWK
jgi:putative phage-type endonuclease